MFELLIIGSIVITIIISFLIRKERSKTLRHDLILYKKDIVDAEKEFKNKYNADLYFSKQTLYSWQGRWKDLKPIVNRYRKTRLQGIDFQDAILNVCNIFENGEELVEKRNDAFIENECEAFKPLFDTLETYPLTDEQRRSVIIDECNTVVVAGAGTGKTSTIVGKVGYLTEKGLAKPEEILLLAFAREAMKEMEHRIYSRLGIQPDVNTFHALGLQIIAEAEGIKPSISDLSTDPRKLRQRMQHFLQQRIGFDQSNNLDRFVEEKKRDHQGNHFLELLNQYFLYHLRPYKSAFEFSSLGEYIAYIKEYQIRSLKGDQVKSYEECEIANFLYINGVNYVYEADYEIQTASRERRQYQPDFYLPEHGIYIEHFGINRKGETAPYVDQKKYREEMAWKRDIHKRYRTKLVETFSYEKSEGVLLSNLEQTLKRYGVPFHRIPNEDLFRKINEMGIVIPFIDLLAKFLNLFKSQALTLDEVLTKAKGYADWQRYSAFLDIFALIYEDYSAYLQQCGTIDFNDMINRATHYVMEQQFNVPYKYILVDEFQDISQSLYRLLKSLLDHAPSSKLFVVGDDWQSIYRFAGSDLSIMTNFSDYFGITEHMYLNQTFRFNNKICEFSSQFIIKNRDQIPKQLMTQQMTDSPAITLVWSESTTNDLLRCLTEIHQVESEEASVFIIGRYRHQKPKRLRVLQNRFPQLSISYLTAHSSKGREADYVIVIGLESGQYSFPCQIQDDPVLNLVLSRPDTYPNAEERRLFYVATTRAKKHVYLLTDSINPSAFVNEILRDKYEVNILNDNQTLSIHCPQCKVGNIIRKDGAWGTFFSCTNYPYCDYKAPTCPACAQGYLYLNQNVYTCSNEACQFRARICPRCREGYLVRRKGRRGAFMGCSTYPRCHYTENQ